MNPKKCTLHLFKPHLRNPRIAGGSHLIKFSQVEYINSFGLGLDIELEMPMEETKKVRPFYLRRKIIQVLLLL